MTIGRQPVKVEDLLFDPKNPRMPDDLQGDQRKIFRFLVDDIGVEDLLNSLAASGMIEGDPIIARPAEGRNAGKFYVVEGNRRLAALKLLTGEKINDGTPEPALPSVGAETAKTLKEVRLELGWDPRKLEAYLGYKHVTAAREWTPEAKAKYVDACCKNDFSDAALSKFAQRLGTNLPTLRRWLIAYFTLKQAEKEGRFDPKEASAKRYFGTFYTLLGSEQVQKFLALKSGALTRKPVPRSHLGHLGEFIGWVIGTKKSPPVINSRAQQKFDAVLASRSALQYFRARRNLEGALLYTEFNSDEIAEKLLSAAYTIEECLPKVFDVRNDPKVRAALENLEGAFQKLKINTTEPVTRAKRSKP
jgi:hypothetical protein